MRSKWTLICVVLALSTAKAHAQSATQVIQKCLDVIENGSAGQQHMSAYAVSRLDTISKDDSENARICVQTVLGGAYVFDEPNGRVVSEEQVAREARRREAAEQKERERRELAEQRERERRERAQKELERLEVKALRISTVNNATAQACVTLYNQDTVVALTNPVCNPIFLQIGLPDAK